MIYKNPLLFALALVRHEVGEILVMRNVVLWVVYRVMRRVGMLVSDSIDLIVFRDDVLHFLKGDVIAFNANLASSLLPVGGVTTAHFVPLLHHGAIILVNLNFLLLIHDVRAFCRRFLIYRAYQ